MPRRLPLRVIAHSIVKFIVRMVERTGRVCLLSLVWLLILPCLTSAVLSLYLGWDLMSLMEGQFLAVLFHTAVGTAVTLLMIVTVLGFFLLREYMETHRLLRIRRHRRRERAAAEAPRPEPHRPNERPTAGDGVEGHPSAAMSEDVAPSEASVRTAATRNTDRSSWMQNVLPREYRAYLRRRELYRARYERASETPQSADFEEAPLMPSGEAASPIIPRTSPPVPALSVSQSNNASASVARISLTRPSIDSSNLDTLDENGHAGLSSHRRRVMQPRESSRGESSHVAATHNSSVSFRDNIRCKICASVVCINKDHVVQASIRARQTEPSTPSTPPQHHQLEGEEAGREEATLPAQEEANNPANDPEPAVPLEEDRGDEPNRANIFNWNADLDNNGITLSEFLGLSGSLLAVFQNALTILCCNCLVIHALVFVPHLIGCHLFKAVQPGRIVSQALADLGTFDWFAVSASSFSGYWLVMGRLAALLPSPVTERVAALWSVLLGHLSSSLLLVRVSPGSLVLAFFQYLVGSLSLYLMLHMYRAAVLRAGFKLSRIHRLLLEVSLMLNAFWKVLAVLSMELVFFPTLFGWLIHQCLSPLFATPYVDRMAFFQTMPILLHLIHWTIGTIVLVKISLLVKWLRESCRPGLLYFIRNSTDPDTFLVKDIIETPTLLLGYRFLLSVVFYAWIMMAHFGGFALACYYLVPNLVPLNFDFRNSLNQAPVDLLVNMISIFLHKTLNTGTVGILTMMVMKVLARLTRLSSYLFGGRYLSEEDLARGRWVFVPDANKMYRAERLREVMSRKVEAWDVARIEIVEGRERTPTPAIDMPLEPRRPLRFPPHVRRSEDSVKGFTVVYRPNRMRLRVLFYLGAMCAFNICLGLVFVVAPILLGRSIFALFHEPAHLPPDIKCYEVGITIVILLIKSAEVCAKTLYERGLRSVMKICLRVPVMIAQTLLVLATVYLLWPIIVGAYLLLLFSPILCAADETPVISFYMSWLIGFLYCQLFIFLRPVLCSEERNAIIARLEKLEGWYDMEFKVVCLRLLLPYTLRIGALMVGPPLAVLLGGSLVDLSLAQIVMLQRWSYAASLAVPGVAFVIWLLMRLRRRLLMRIRDDNYLVGRRLHNLDRRGTAVGEAAGTSLRH